MQSRLSTSPPVSVEHPIDDVDTACPTAHADPPATGGRLLALDVLRGLAILGTLATNIGIFIWVNEDPAINETLDRAGTFVFSLVTNGYWIGLLTIMFGIGMAIQRESAVRRGEPWLGSYPWRAAVLIFVGFLNYVFVVPFDVLMGYGLTALVVCVVMVAPGRVQSIVLVLGVVGHVAYLSYLSSTESGIWDRRIDRWLERFREEGMAQVGYWDGVRESIDSFWTGGRAEIPIMFLMGLGVFLIGARLWDAGIFVPEGAKLRTRVMWIGFGIGLPIDWGLRTAQTFVADFPVWTFTFVRYLTATVVAFGVLALVANFYAERDRTGRIGSALSLVGRMALSCYLLQNILALGLFGDFALDLDAKAPVNLGVFNLVLAFALVSTLLIGFAALWLRRFERGPLETVTHAVHRWLVGNTTERVLARRRAPESGSARNSL